MTFEVVCSSRYIQMMNPRHGSIEFSLHSEPSPNKAGRGQRPEKVGPPAEARGANGMTGRVLNKAVTAQTVDVVPFVSWFFVSSLWHRLVS